MGFDLCTRGYSISLTGSGLDFLLNVLDGLGVVDASAPVPSGDGSVWPPGDVDEDLAEEILESCDEWREAGVAYAIEELPGSRAERARIVEAVGRFHASLSWESPSGKVPAFKFGSNDGWIVTSQEIALISGALSEALPTFRGELGKLGRHEQQLLKVLEDFAVLLEASRRHGEFRVF